MIEGKTIAAVIPARGGSLELPRKNLKKCLQWSLLEHAIYKAKRCGICDVIWVSSEDDEILETAAAAGIRMDYRRPAAMAEADSPVEDAIADILRWHEVNRDIRTDYVLLLQPTTPLTPPLEIRKALHFLIEKDVDAIVSVCETSCPLGVCKPLYEFNMRGFLTPEQQRLRRQDMPHLFQLNNCILAAKWDVFAEKKNLYETNVIAHIMSPLFSVDINTKTDLMIAQYILQGILHDRKKRKPVRQSLSDDN